MIEVETTHEEHKEPKKIIQGGIEGGENTPLGDENKIYIPN